MTTKPKILIVGAAIGGLTAAIALRQAGFGVEVFERAAELKEIGAGIALSANAIRVLKHLGRMQQVIDRGAVIEAAASYNSRGDTISALPPDCIHLGDQFVNFENTGARMMAHFASGRAASGDALIGADGLRSRVRAQLIGDGEPVYRGYQCWRGVCNHPASELLTETCGLGLRVGLVPIGHRGSAWWCTANEAEFANDGTDGAKSKLLRWFGNWHQPIPEVIGATDPT